MRIYRHGDVLIASVSAIPSYATPHADRILAYGEATGHAHRVESNGAVETYDGQNEMFLVVREHPARVVHEEHAPIDLPVGLYRVWRQRQYRPNGIPENVED